MTFGLGRIVRPSGVIGVFAVLFLLGVPANVVGATQSKNAPAKSSKGAIGSLSHKSNHSTGFGLATPSGKPTRSGVSTISGKSVKRNHDGGSALSLTAKPSNKAKGAYVQKPLKMIPTSKAMAAQPNMFGKLKKGTRSADGKTSHSSASKTSSHSSLNVPAAKSGTKSRR